MMKRDVVESMQRRMDSIIADRAGAAEASDKAPDAPSAADAFARLFRIVSNRDRSERDARRRLSDAGFSEEDVDRAVERARNAGILDDLRFADLLIRSRISQGRGRAGIERELADQGIDVDAVSGWPDEYFDDGRSELERALSLLDRKPPTAKNKREAAYRRLVGKGFSSSVASEAARTFAFSQLRED
ncbi:regulatory protein RecX [Berryella intestinalis]|uniref:regulatory protein RecX n=1 Tax=Berryella intestinalis TaxID=1531429 RepID=UPI00068EC8DF|nr:regulatory protein RecX [Berryella intestinalis]